MKEIVERNHQIICRALQIAIPIMLKHSMSLGKRLAKEELRKRAYPGVWSDFSLEVVDKTILMSDFGISK